VIVSSPSGAGKTTLVKKISSENNFSISISHTTRKPRSYELDGSHYFFVSNSEFKKLISNEKFLEYAKVFNNYYGSLKNTVIDKLNKGENIIFDIDWQGTQHLYDNDSTRDDLVSVFILPPDTVELEKRLRRRARDPEEVVRERMSKAADEMSHYREYNYIIVNTDIENSVAEVQSILAAERHRIDRQIGLHDFVQDLRGLTD